MNRLLERKYLATIHPWKPESMRGFVDKIVDESLPQAIAVSASGVVGWCDIIPASKDGFRHCGVLGMGVVKAHRGRGLGSKLLAACVESARDFGLEKIELEVYSDNQAAISLYQQHGFVVNGLRQRARKLDGQYQDIQLMSKFLVPSSTA